MSSPVRRTSRPGRPIGGDGDATRARILLAARAAFAELGYAATTYRLLAERTGLAPSALYNYFDSKAELYAAVHDDVKLETYAGWILPAIADTQTFAARIDALLECFIAHNPASPEVAQFLAAARIDTARQPELSAVRDGLASQRRQLIADMVDLGIATGELPASSREHAMAMLDTLILGLLDVAADVDAHRHAVEGFRDAIGFFSRRIDRSTRPGEPAV